IREQLVQQTEPLRGNIYIHKCDTGNVAARSIQAGDETSWDWIASSSENDRDGPGRSLGLHYRSRALWCDNYRHVPTNQIGRQFRQLEHARHTKGWRRLSGLNSRAADKET